MTISYPLSLPAVGGIRGIRLISRSVVSVSESPFTFSQQVQAHQGQRWEAQISLPAMKRADAEQWVTFLQKLKGRVGTFLLGDPNGQTPRGTIAGSAQVDGDHSARSTTLAIKNLTVGTTLLAGDYIQSGSGSSARLYKNLSDQTADGSGEMTLDIWPSLRSALSSDAALVYTAPKGLFRLSDNIVSVEINEAMIYGLGFNAVEVI